MEPCKGDYVESAKDDNKSSPISVMISDPRAFDCCICFQPLTIPAFLCDNGGHIVCSTCCDKLGNKCDKCSKDIILKHCSAFDNLLKSIKISCSNEKYGCKETISYIDKKMHEEKCIYIPCYCPLSGCDFVASYDKLSNHFTNKHGYSLIKFSYDHSFIAFLKSNDEVQVTVLKEKNNGKLFFLKTNTTSMGNSINISYIGPKSSANYYCYDILARSEICNLKLESSEKNFQQVDSTTLSPEFLVIPFGFFGSSKNHLKLEICINHKIQIFVAITRRWSRKMISLKVESSDTIANLKLRICEMDGLPVEQQRMMFGNKQLDDNLTIADYSIKAKSTIHIVSSATS
ncbi:E3 ubiquitin-protein ligase SINA-like 10 [Vicia villosa]|uniref:E3 ubiquitin-protein ligase SINA-like 10 n=1 Tax=Vicia villosa TaxID=3911 RepID=UPI00273BB53E|nr:E3 ubiquitin-protein ligase SINA-like 10 [Vicia villosa]